MKVIETLYADHRFRSRLEARYARFLDLLGEPWLYEDEGYDLDGDYYLPDFFLPNRDTFLEVKGKYPNDREIRVARKLQFHAGYDVMICYGLPRENDAIHFGRSDDNGGALTETFVDWPWPQDAKMHVAILGAKQERFTVKYSNSRLLPNTVDYNDIRF